MQFSFVPYPYPQWSGQEGGKTCPIEKSPAFTRLYNVHDLI